MDEEAESNIYDNDGMNKINAREVYIDEVLYFPMFISEEIQGFVYKNRKKEEISSIFQIFFFALFKIPLIVKKT